MAMTRHPLLKLLRGPFNFLLPEHDELELLIADPQRSLPLPQAVHLEDERATPLSGFPVLITADLRSLSRALEEYLCSEEEMQVAHLRRQGFDARQYGQAWDRYRALLGRAVENVTVSSFGRHHPSIFWLHQSLDVSRLLRDTPRRVTRLDSQVGRQHGEEIKYRVLHRYLDRAVSLTYDLVNRLALDTDEIEEELFPPLLNRMRDNVLILTETHIGPDLAELGAYFNGHLRVDGRDLRARLATLEDWHAERLRSDPALRRTVRLAYGSTADKDPRLLLSRRGYLTYLAARPDYDAGRLPTAAQVPIWESLLLKLKEFELLHALRKLVVPVEREDGGALLWSDRGSGRGRSPLPLRLSHSTRPLDFMSPWVVDPQVSRCGLIYDISNFSEIIARLRWSTTDVQDDSFRSIFRFQRRVNRLARGHRLTLEKYLGDGAFYSGREARGALAASLRVQAHYRQVLAEGFPFDRGMRMALNFGQYRLLPIQGASTGGAERYEFFGQGVIELSRLVTGKATRDIDELKTLLLNLGYPEATVNRFFAPLLEQGVELVDKSAEARRFYAYVNQNGTLINEGIVATGPFLERLAVEGGFSEVQLARDAERSYVALSFEDGGGLCAGVRKLGVTHLKGIDRLPVYEVVDAGGLERAPLDLGDGDLMGAIEREFANSLGGIRARSS
jgi:hypothetical protein